jgi:hypothetical protein
MNSLVDMVLSYNTLNVNSPNSMYRAVYSNIMRDVSNMTDDIPPIDADMSLLSDMERENLVMFKYLNERRSGEHYSSFMKRVFSFANTLVSNRDLYSKFYQTAQEK